MLLNYDKADMWNGKIRFRPDGTVIPGNLQFLLNYTAITSAKVTDKDTTSECRRIRDRYFSYEDADTLCRYILSQKEYPMRSDYFKTDPEIIFVGNNASVGSIIGSQSFKNVKTIYKGVLNEDIPMDIAVKGPLNCVYKLSGFSYLNMASAIKDKPKGLKQIYFVN